MSSVETSLHGGGIEDGRKGSVSRLIEPSVFYREVLKQVNLKTRIIPAGGVSGTACRGPLSENNGGDDRHC